MSSAGAPAKNGARNAAAQTLSPQSASGVSTPKASVASLPGQNGSAKAAPLEAEIQHLKVQQSPSGAGSSATIGAAGLGGPSLGQAMDIDAPSAPPAPAQTNGSSDITHANRRGTSSSTESSSADDTDHHPIPPSHLGSMYGSDGFLAQFADTSAAGSTPVTLGLNGGSGHGEKTASPERMMMLTPEAAAAVSAADEIIKQLNGTSSVITGDSDLGVLNYGGGGGDVGGYIPRNFGHVTNNTNNNNNNNGSNFAKPREPRQPVDYASHRQSSTSSSTTEASTSSEESDLCVPTIEWVSRPDAAASANNQNWGFQPYLPPATGPRSAAGSTRSPARMPPPASTGRSPRRTSNGLAHAAGQAGASGSSSYASAPTGLRNASALPAGFASDLAAEDDDDEATIGHGRDRSPSSSSQSAQSNLDVLSRAASLRGVPREASNPAGAVVDTKGKRKAGADAVAQWREGGIPSGFAADAASSSSSAAQRQPYDENAYPRHGDPHGEAPKKRRRSEVINNEVIDPSLRDMIDQDAVMGGPGEEEQSSSDSNDDGSHPDDYVASDNGDAASDEGEEDDDGLYGSGGAAAGPSSGGRGKKESARGKAAAAKSNKSRGRISGASAAKTGPSTYLSAMAASAGQQKKRKGEVSPSGAIKGGRKSAGTVAPGGGVQCDYVNPLPPYNRCQDVFTRKYDLPRHMARHARREGELVYEGKLQESKALLWATIKDKPKVACEVCGESFTRMDALKRHQAKQHGPPKPAAAAASRSG